VKLVADRRTATRPMIEVALCTWSCEAAHDTASVTGCYHEGA
jgi:hypothetical protein